MKVCSRCKQAKPQADFYKNRSKPDGLTHSCRECQKQDKQQYNQLPSAKAKRRAREKQYRLLPHVKAKNRAWQKKYDQLPHVKARKRRDAKRRDELARARGSRTYRHHRLVASANFRAKRSGATGHISFKDWLKILEAYAYKCLACGSDRPGLDHIVPLSKGGTHTAGNLQPLCISCNCRKAQKSTDYRPEHQEVS